MGLGLCIGLFFMDMMYMGVLSGLIFEFNLDESSSSFFVFFSFVFFSSRR